MFKPQKDLNIVVKNIAKSFVRKMEVNEDGMVNESEFKDVVQYLVNFVNPKVIVPSKNLLLLSLMGIRFSIYS